MKKYVFGASLVAGLSMIAAPAAMAQATGYVDASWGQLTADSGGTSQDIDLVAVDGSVALPLNGLYFQADASFNNISDGGVDANILYGSAHLGVRNAQWAAAGFVGLSQNDNADTSAVYYGGEAAYYLPQMTFAGVVGMANFDDSNLDIWGINGEGRYFVSDNLRFDAHVGFGNLDAGGATDFDSLNYGLGAEWKPDNFPVSFFGVYDMNSIDDANLDLSTFSIGARFDFGNGTLKLRDRSGPTFRSMGGLEGFGRLF